MEIRKEGKTGSLHKDKFSASSFTLEWTFSFTPIKMYVQPMIWGIDDSLMLVGLCHCLPEKHWSNKCTKLANSGGRKSIEKWMFNETIVTKYMQVKTFPQVFCVQKLIAEQKENLYVSVMV